LQPTVWRTADEIEQRSRQVIEAIRQVVLNPDADDVPVFFHSLAGRI
jgi:ABC-type antimicrobial peptide transport system ATPase subunit